MLTALNYCQFDTTIVVVYIRIRLRVPERIRDNRSIIPSLPLLDSKALGRQRQVFCCFEINLKDEWRIFSLVSRNMKKKKIKAFNFVRGTVS